MTNAGPNSDAPMREARRNAFGERLTDATGRSQPLAPANAAWSGRTPPTTPAQERMLWASGAPIRLARRPAWRSALRGDLPDRRPAGRIATQRRTHIVHST